MDKWTFGSLAPTPEAVGANGNIEYKRKTWKSALCNCCCSWSFVCCCVLWCQPCTIAQLYGLSSASPLRPRLACNIAAAVLLILMVVGSSTYYSSYAVSSVMMSAASILSFLFVFQARGRIREMYGIRGSGCGDCLSSFFCLSCSVCQMFKEKQVEMYPSNPQSIKYTTPCEVLEDAPENVV
jgi:Cys-rich protein (TIGR01571 family)